MKTLLVANTDWYLYKFRIAQVKGLRELGAEVVLATPAGPYVDGLKEMGFCWLELPITRSGMNPFVESGTVLRFFHLYRREKPALVHHFTIKCVLYGSLAAKAAGVPVIINGVTGLGFAFSGEEGRKRLLRFLVERWYRLALRGTQAIFDNDEDRQFFVEKRLVRPDAAHVIRSAGVDVTLYVPTPEPEGTPVVMLGGRMLWDKGVAEFAEAARQVRARGVEARFVLVGNTDPGNMAAIPVEQLQRWHESGLVEWWGWQGDMPSVYRRVNLVCLPSYREGLPTTLIEAGACGRAVVATDVTGCRHAVRHGVTGLLVKPRDAPSLAEGIITLLRDPPLRRRMAEAGRQMVSAEFSTERVNRDTWHVYAKAGLKGLPL